jgi:hypothetical protein
MYYECLVKEKRDAAARTNPKTVNQDSSHFGVATAAAGEELFLGCWCNRPMALAAPAEGSRRWAFQMRFGDPRFTHPLCSGLVQLVGRQNASG